MNIDNGEGRMLKNEQGSAFSFEYRMHAVVTIDESKFIEAASKQGLSIEKLRANQAQIAGYRSKGPKSEEMLLVTLLDKEGNPVGRRDIQIDPSEYKGRLPG